MRKTDFMQMNIVNLKNQNLKTDQEVMYIPVNEDEVDFSENDLTDGYDFQDEDDTILLMMRKMMKWLLTINM